MERLAARGERLARLASERQVQDIARQLRRLFGDGTVDVEEGRVLVGGRQMVKRWLLDPGVRFLGGGPK
jgi:hypothetical protein